MAKLVALDAMGLQEAVADSDDLPQETLGNAKIADAVNLF